MLGPGPRRCRSCERPRCNPPRAFSLCFVAKNHRHTLPRRPSILGLRLGMAYLPRTSANSLTLLAPMRSAISLIARMSSMLIPLAGLGAGACAALAPLAAGAVAALAALAAGFL